MRNLLREYIEAHGVEARPKLTEVEHREVEEARKEIMKRIIKAGPSNVGFAFMPPLSPDPVNIDDFIYDIDATKFTVANYVPRPLSGVQTTNFNPDDTVDEPIIVQKEGE